MLRSVLPVSRPASLNRIRLNHTSQWLGNCQLNKVQQRYFADSQKRDPKLKPSLYDSDSAVLPGSESQTAKGPTPPPPGPIISLSPANPTPPTPNDIPIIPPENVPLVPPPPPAGKTQTSPPQSLPRKTPRDAEPTPITAPPTLSTPPTRPSPPPSIPPAPPTPPTSKSGATSPPPKSLPKKKKGRFRRFLLYLFLLGGFSFAGGVYYSLLSDNFHDFFTEYIPFGEDAVLYFEEREYRKRFPRMTNPTNRPPPPDSGNKITIPSNSGLSWKLAEGENQGSSLEAKGRHMSALDGEKSQPTAKNVSNAQRTPTGATPEEKTKAVEKAKVETSSTAFKEKPSDSNPKVEAKEPKSEDAKPKVEATKAKNEAAKPKDEVAKLKDEAARLKDGVTPTVKEAEKLVPTINSPKGEKPKESSTVLPEVDEPSRIMPIPPIDPLKIDHANEPLVQDLVKNLNDIITVVNADNASGKYSSAIRKAKSELANVGKRILALKQAENQAAEAKIKSTEAEFDKAAKELVRRLEEEMKDQEARWRDDFESEREKIYNSYQERLQNELKRSEEISNQRLRNELLEQAIAMKQQFASSIKDCVDTERSGRLSKLSDLASSVAELEDLTSQWNKVVDSNLQTQHLQVAVEAVRASLDTADRPRPFIHELAALKELGAKNPVIDAAIASINPTAYQRGVPTSAQLIDRFRRVAGEVRKASLLPEDAGVASHAASWALSRLLLKKKGMTVGDDVESVLTRTETLLEEGDLDAAAREMNGLAGWAKKLSEDWIAEARRVLEVRQAVEVIGAETRLLGLGVD